MELRKLRAKGMKIVRQKSKKGKGISCWQLATADRYSG